MTADDASTAASIETPAGNGEYDEMLDTLDVAVDEAKRKVESGRVYDEANERVRIKWIRALGYLMNIRRQIARDKDLEELAERVELLEETS